LTVNTLQAIDIKTKMCYEEVRITAMPERILKHYSRINRILFVKGILKGLKYVGHAKNLVIKLYKGKMQIQIIKLNTALNSLFSQQSTL